MKTLALEFSSDRRSVAVADGGQILGEASESLGRESHPFALIRAALGQARRDRGEIQRLVVGLGPGSYNGVRTAIAVAQGWQLARGTLLGGISSVDGLAEEARVGGIRGQVHAVVDAQRGEFYLATYAVRSDGIESVTPLRIVGRNEIEALLAAGGAVIGPDVARGPAGVREVFPSAAALARLACGRFTGCAAEELEPIYLRETAFVKAPPPRRVPGLD